MDKPIATIGSSTGLDIIESIALGDLENVITEQYATVNGEPLIDFFKLIKEQYQTDKSFNLLFDGAGSHRRKLVVKEAENVAINYII